MSLQWPELECTHFRSISRDISLHEENMTAMENMEATTYRKGKTQDKEKVLMTFRLLLLIVVDRIFISALFHGFTTQPNLHVPGN